jgi:hypothetical protein
MRLRIALSITLTAVCFLGLLLPLASASSDDPKKAQTSRPLTMAYKSKLEVKEFSGDFERWAPSRVLESAASVTFRWNTLQQGVASTIYQVTETPGGFGDSATSPTPSLVAIGSAGPVPTQGQFTQFTISFAAFAPKSPPKSPKLYYVRIVTRNAQREGVPSSQVTITYQDTTNQTTDFSGIPAPPPPTPMYIETKLESFIVNGANEGERSDEPYLFVAVVYLDGTTIMPWDLAHSKVRIDSPYQTHGNILGASADADGDIPNPGTGVPYLIPEATGRFQKGILPIAGLHRFPQILALPNSLKGLAQTQAQTLAKDLSMVAVLVVALEEDNTPTKAIQAGRRAFEESLREELSAFVRGLNSLTLPEVQKLKDDPQAFAEAFLDQVKSKIKAKALAAMKKWVMQNTVLVEPTGILAVNAIAGKDDLIGIDYRMFSYREIEKAASKGLAFTLNLDDPDTDGSYSINGKIRWQCHTIQDQKKDPHAWRNTPLCP